MEGDASGRGLERGQHGRRGQRIHAIFLIQSVHCGQQARTARLAVHFIEQVERVQAIGDQSAEMHADKKGRRAFRTLRL